MNADHSRRTFLLGGLATGAVLLAGKTFLHPSAAHAATEAVTLDVCVNMTPGEMADRSQYQRRISRSRRLQMGMRRQKKRY